MLPEDLVEIEEFLLNQEVKFILQPTKDSENITTSTIRFPKVEGEFDKIFIVPSNRVEAIKLDYIRKQDYWLVNEKSSPVIEFSRGNFNTEYNILNRSRMYVIKEFYNNENKVFVKNNEFLDWADNLMKNFKKEFLVENEDRLWYTSRVVEWMEFSKSKLEPSGLTIK